MLNLLMNGLTKRILVPIYNRWPDYFITYQISNQLRFKHTSVSEKVNYYELLELPTNVSIRDIKHQFKELSKKYHPDLNNRLSPKDRERNNVKFVAIVSAYDTLKDSNKKKEYDMKLKLQRTYIESTSRRSNEWQNMYYGEVKYYSKSGTSYSANGLNTKRHKVHSFGHHVNNSTFSGRHINYGDRFDVPHFNYNEHLSKHLKFEQRIINKRLTEEDRKKILKQLSKDGDISNLSEELITKHLMRQIHHSYHKVSNISKKSSRSSTTFQSPKSNFQNPYMYHDPYNDSDEDAMIKIAMLLCGAGTLYFLYNILFQ